jgi:phosphoribosylformylglycinamidine synthase
MAQTARQPQEQTACSWQTPFRKPFWLPHRNPPPLGHYQTHIKQGSVLTCHDLSEGGLAVAAAEMAFAGGIGVQIELKSGSIVPLFSESNTRFLVEVSAATESAFTRLLAGVTVEKLGSTSMGEERIITSSGQQLVRADLKELKSCWQKPLA